MQPSEIEITALIPQRPPVVMIDRLTFCDEKSCTGQLLVTGTNLFCTNGHFSEAGITEFIAQTAAAYKGYQRISSGKDIKKGYIAAVKNLVIHALPPSGETIECLLEIDSEVIGYTIVKGKVSSNSQLIAEAELRIIVES